MHAKNAQTLKGTGPLVKTKWSLEIHHFPLAKKEEKLNWPSACQHNVGQQQSNATDHRNKT